LTDTTSVTSLLASVSGVLPCNGQDSETQLEFGPALAPASPSPALAPEKEPQTSGTCGRSSETSLSLAVQGSSSASKSPAPQLSERLGEALQSRLSRFGSMEYGQTWKLRVTPLGLRYWAHTVSGRPISASGCTGSRTAGYTTPRQSDPKTGHEYTKNMTGKSLAMDADLAGHPTPMCPNKDAGNSDFERKVETMFGLRESVNAPKLAGHPTPSSEGSAGEISEDLERIGSKFRNRKTGRILQTNLATDTLMLCGHPTPTSGTGGGDQSDPEAALLRMRGRSNLDDAACLAGNPTPTRGDAQKVTPFHDAPQPALAYLCHLAGHPSPRAEDSEQTGAHRGEPDTLNSCSKLALTGHPTAAARDWRDGRSNQHGKNSRPLNEVEMLAGHATPRVTTNSGIGNPDRACDGKSRLEDQCLGATTASTDTSTAKTAGFRLNPGFSLWLMIGIPTIVDAWASCGGRAMELYRRSPRSS
jgi:hypothetical protein